MITWLRTHLIWTIVLTLSGVAVSLILADLFQLGVFVFAAAAFSLAAARAMGVQDKLLHVRSRSVDIAIYMAFTISLTVLAIVLPTG